MIHVMIPLELLYLTYTYLKLPYTISRIEMRNVETRDESIIEYALKKVMLALIVNDQPQTNHSTNILPNLPLASSNITALHVILCDFLNATTKHICFQTVSVTIYLIILTSNVNFTEMSSYLTSNSGHLPLIIHWCGHCAGGPWRR